MARRARRDGVAIGAELGHGCAPDFDTVASRGTRGTLGREMYTMVCDRVGAQALREDVAGISYHSVCHADANGDVRRPSRPREASRARRSVRRRRQAGHHRAAGQEPRPPHRAHRGGRAPSRRSDRRVRHRVRQRGDRNEGPREPGPSATLATRRPGPSGEADLRVELVGHARPAHRSLRRRHHPAPHARASRSVMDDVEHSPDAQAALARFDARRGYRPRDVAMGVARPTLAYPRLVELANALLRLLSSDTDPLGLAAGAPPQARRRRRPPTASPRIAFRVPRTRRSSTCSRSSRRSCARRRRSRICRRSASRTDPRDPMLVRLSRPRGNLEMARAIFLAQDPAFSEHQASRTGWCARDARGFAKVASADGKVPSPFVDLTGGPKGTPGRPARRRRPRPLRDHRGARAVAVPRLQRGRRAGRRRQGLHARRRRTRARRRQAPRTSTSTRARRTSPRSSAISSRSLDPDPKLAHETVMDLLGGFTVVAGQRNAGKDSHRFVRRHAGRVSRVPRGSVTAPRSRPRRRSGPRRSHRPTTRSRSCSASRRTSRRSSRGSSAPASASRRSPTSIPRRRSPPSPRSGTRCSTCSSKIAQKPKLIEAIIRAFGDDRTLDLAKSGAAYMEMRDQLTYDRSNLNGPPFNLTTSKVDTLTTPVDRSQADTGTNRSAFQRFLQTLHDANGLSICTKQGAVAHIVWNGIALDFPSFAAQAAASRSARTSRRAPCRSAECSASRTSRTTSSTRCSVR